MHHTIVVAASKGRPRHDALALGVALARPRGAEVLLTHVATRPGQHSSDLDEVAAGAPRDVPVRALPVTAATVVAGLHRAVSEQDAELLVMGSSLRSTVTRMVRGDIAMGVVRDAPCAIAAAPLGYAAKPPRAPQRIGVAWAEGPDAAEALEWAVQLAERTAGSVTLIHVLDAAGDQAAARARLEELSRAASVRAPATFDLRRGDRSVALAGGADLDLMVVGSRRRGPVGRVVLGSVSAEVLNHATCPVVVLPRGVQAPVETTA